MAGMGRRKPLQLVMNGGKPKFRCVLFNENRVFVQASLLFFMCDSVSISFYFMLQSYASLDFVFNCSKEFVPK